MTTKWKKYVPPLKKIKDLEGGWRNGSDGKALALQAQGPGFNPQNLCKKNNHSSNNSNSSNNKRAAGSQAHAVVGL